MNKIELLKKKVIQTVFRNNSSRERNGKQAAASLCELKKENECRFSEDKLVCEGYFCVLKEQEMERDSKLSLMAPAGTCKAQGGKWVLTL